MQFQLLLTIFTTTTLASVLASTSVPETCTPICKPFVNLDTACNLNTASGNNLLSSLPSRFRRDAASQCICNQDEVKTAGMAALCFNCVQEYGDAGKITAEQLTAPCLTPAAAELAAMDSGAASIENSRVQATKAVSGTGKTHKLGASSVVIVGLVASWLCV